MRAFLSIYRRSITLAIAGVSYLVAAPIYGKLAHFAPSGILDVVYGIPGVVFTIAGVAALIAATLVTVLQRFH